MTINVYLQTKGDLTSKGDHYLITAYIYRYKSAIDYFIDASLKEQNIDRRSKSLTEMTVPQKRKLLIETTTYLPYQFSYLYFDKKSITNEKLFEDKEQLKAELFKCFLSHWYKVSPKSNFQASIDTYNEEDRITLEAVTKELNKQGKKRLVRENDETEPISFDFLELTEDIFYRHQSEGETDLYKILPIINPVVIHQSSFSKDGTIKEEVLKAR